MEQACSICLESMSSSNEEVLLCQHKYHTHCIEKWSARHSTCPLCRKSMGCSREELLQVYHNVERVSFCILIFVLLVIKISHWLFYYSTKE